MLPGKDRAAYAPFGESYAEATNTGGTIDHSFTGQNEDTAGGLDDFLFREYSASQQGRWISPDPAGFDAVSIEDPQSWNRYSYAYNRPCGLVDIQGLTPCKITISGAAGLEGALGELNKILGPDVTVEFTNTDAELTLKQNVPLGTNIFGYGQQVDPNVQLNNSEIERIYNMYANNPYEFPQIPYDLNLGYGRTIAHELGHVLFGAGEPGGIMAPLENQGSTVFDPNVAFAFIKSQADQLKKKCQALRRRRGGGGRTRPKKEVLGGGSQPGEWGGGNEFDGSVVDPECPGGICIINPVGPILVPRKQ